MPINRANHLMTRFKNNWSDMQGRAHDCEVLLRQMSELGTKTYRSQECLALNHDYVLVERGLDCRPQANIGETCTDRLVKRRPS